MAFERFTRTGKSYKPKISIRSNGQMGFNQGAIKKFELGNFQYVILFFDNVNQRIGFKLTNEEEEGICKLKVRKSNASVSAKAFLDYYSIDYSKTRRLEAMQDEKEEMIVISLNVEK